MNNPILYAIMGHHAKSRVLTSVWTPIGHQKDGVKEVLKQSCGHSNRGGYLGKKFIQFPKPISIDLIEWVTNCEAQEIYQWVKKKLCWRASLVSKYYQRWILRICSGEISEDAIPPIFSIFIRLTIDCPWGYHRGPDETPFPYLPDPYHFPQFLEEVVAPNQPDYLILNRKMIFEFSEMVLDEIFEPIPVCTDLLYEYNRLKSAVSELKHTHAPLEDYYEQRGSFRLSAILPDDPSTRISLEGVKDLWEITPSQVARESLKDLYPEIKGYIEKRLTRAKKEKAILEAWEKFWKFFENNPPIQEELTQLLINPKLTPLLI